MDSELFARLKKIAKREGKIIFADDKDVFVILPLQEYEIMAQDFCDGECDDEDCGCHQEFDNDSGEDVFADDGGDKDNEDDDEDDEDEDDKELIRKVNEDIAKWREEQQKNEKTEKQKNEGRKQDLMENADDLNKIADERKAKEDVLTEEERYYLEPLE